MTKFKQLSTHEFYVKMLDAINDGDDNYISHAASYILRHDIQIKYPNYILIAGEMYLKDPTYKRLQIFMILYYSGFRTDAISYFISSDICNETRKRLFEIELQYALDTNKNIQDIWDRYQKSIYVESYRDIYESYLLDSMYINHKVKDYFAFIKTVFNYMLCNYKNKTTNRI